MTLHALQHLKSRALSGIVYIFLISQTVETYTSHIGQIVLFHNVVNPLQHKIRHGIVDLTCCQNDVGQSRIISHQKPWVHRDAMSANTRSRSQNIDTGMLVGNTDDLVHVHVI